MTLEYDYIFDVIFAAYVIFSAYWLLTAKRRRKRNLTAVMSRSDEYAAQAHMDAERIIALLAEIKDRLDQRS